jgi:type II secretory pathway pseudopilin PulG
MKINSKKAFTLIELILFMALFTIILGILTNLFSVIVDTQNEVQSTSAVENDSKFITARMLYDIQHADEITTPASIGAETSNLVLSIDGQTYQYSLSGGNLVLTVGSESDNLNGFGTQVSNLTFQRFGNIGGKNAVRLHFTIDSTNKTAAGQETKEIETMIGLR